MVRWRWIQIPASPQFCEFRSCCQGVCHGWSTEFCCRWRWWRCFFYCCHQSMASRSCAPRTYNVHVHVVVAFGASRNPFEKRKILSAHIQSGKHTTNSYQRLLKQYKFGSIAFRCERFCAECCPHFRPYSRSSTPSWIYSVAYVKQSQLLYTSLSTVGPHLPTHSHSLEGHPPPKKNKNGQGVGPTPSIGNEWMVWARAWSGFAARSRPNSTGTRKSRTHTTALISHLRGMPIVVLPRTSSRQQWPGR